MSEKYKKTSKHLSYVEHLLILASTVTGCVSISAFASLDCGSVDITSSVIGIKLCVITTGMKNYKPIIKKKSNRSIKLNSVTCKS